MPSAVPRLKRRGQFLRVAGTRRRWAAPGLVLQVRRHRPDERDETAIAPVRVGFTASRKVGKAVARNRIRRRLRAAAEQVLPAHARPGHDFVVVARRAALTRPFPALLGDLETALRRLDAYCEEPDECDKQGAGDPPGHSAHRERAPTP